MKYFCLGLLVACNAVSLEYKPFKLRDDPPLTYSGMVDIVKRGDVKDFADTNVDKAMKVNPSSGKFPVPDFHTDIIDDVPAIPPRLDYWDDLVVKGNEDFTNKQVLKAEALKPEPIVINGQVMKPRDDPPLDPFE